MLPGSNSYDDAPESVYTVTATPPAASSSVELAPVEVKGSNLKYSLYIIGAAALLWWIFKRKKR